MTERLLVEQVARYLQLQYPDVIYRFDIAADLKLTMGQARRHKLIHPKRGYPDLFIAHPTNKLTHDCGLYIELKVKPIYRRDGELFANAHLREQDEMLARLGELGYVAKFAVGFDQAKEIIDEYLG